MKRRLLTCSAALALLVVPATSLGGAAPEADGTGSARRAGLGDLVAKDVARQHPEAAAARARLTEFGKVSYVISTKPGHLPVDWAFIVRCQKGFLFDYYPGPGDVKTTTKKATIKGTYNIPLADPDLCDFQVAGQIAGRQEVRGKVFAKIYNKG